MAHRQYYNKLIIIKHTEKENGPLKVSTEVELLI